MDGGERPAFNKTPYAPRADAPEGGQSFDKPYEKKPFAKGPGAKKPFKPKSDFKAGGKPGFKPFAKGPKGGKRFD